MYTRIMYLCKITSFGDFDTVNPDGSGESDSMIQSFQCVERGASEQEICRCAARFTVGVLFTTT